MQDGVRAAVDWAALLTARRALGIRQGAMAERMGCSPSAVCLRERGRLPVDDAFRRRYRSALAQAVLGGELETEA